MAIMLGGFESIQNLVRPGGYIIIGLYNRYGRLRTYLRRYLFKILGQKFLMVFDPVLRKMDRNDKEKINSWIRDQYTHPVESTHTFDEVLGWFKENKFGYLNPEYYLPPELLNNNIFLITRPESTILETYQLLNSKLEAEGIKIKSKSNANYQIKYKLESGYGEIAKVSLYYNKKGHIKFPKMYINPVAEGIKIIY